MTYRDEIKPCGPLPRDSTGSLILDNSHTRDGWCTPQWLCDLLPEVDIDPASNARSTIRAKIACDLHRGDDGLVIGWHGLVWVNGPFSDLMPWVEKLHREIRNIYGAGFLVNADHSTTWFRVLSRLLPLRFDFSKRIQFVPPPGVTASTNSKPQTLLMTETFWAECHEDLRQHGTLWRRQ